MKNKNTRCLIILTCLLVASCSNVFKKGYKAYEHRDYPAAQLAFEQYREHPKLAPAARFFLAKIKLADSRELPGLLALDQSLIATDSMFRRLPLRQIRRQTRRYQIDTNAIAALREETQRWAIAWTRVQGTLPALDALLDGLPNPLPIVRPDIENTHRDIVNAHLETTDYDTMTAILHQHIEYVLPENYEHTRRMYDQLWTAFTGKYSPCEIDRFAREYPLSFAGSDCWLDEIRPLLCTGTLPQLLDFHAYNRWTALEIVLLNRIADLSEDEGFDFSSLKPEQQQQLADLQARADLRGNLLNRSAQSDTLATLEQGLEYISRYAPRYSAFRLMEETLQFFLKGQYYASAIELLESARPHFPDTLPPDCHTNFDYQRRVKPWIDGKLPILRRPEQSIVWHRLDKLNSPEGDEYSPVVRADEQEIFFAAKNRAGQAAGAEVFTAHWDTIAQDWSVPVLVPELSGPGQQVPLSLTADGLQMLLFCNLQLSLSQRSSTDSPWGKPEPLPVSGIPVMGKGFLSADGNTLLLEGSYSAGSATYAPDLDLFVSFYDPVLKTWSRPAALGASINTDGQEASPCLSADGRTLFYTCTDYPGLGNSDIFQAQRTQDDWTHWTRPLNLGKAINDTYPHRGFSSISADGKTAWLSMDGEIFKCKM